MQDKVIKGLQSEVQQLQVRLHPPRADSSCQTPAAAIAHAACQAAPSMADASQQAQPGSGCCAATQTESAEEATQGQPCGQGVRPGETSDSSPLGGGRAGASSQGTQTEESSLR